ncbi:MAG: choice-of-anchor E domain-containing protein [Bacteroidota bacterium]|nr:choice-of-anchor E domain-containing protein [Bacteroidota bacterium]
MKILYPTLLALLAIVLIPPESSVAQCTCADGSTPSSITYSQYFDSITTTNSTITFPQFDPSIGQLTCLNLGDTVTTIVNYNLENDLDTATSYMFETYRRSQFTGPNSFFSSVISAPKDYGPYLLGPYDTSSTADQVNVGPDTVFYNNVHNQYTSSIAGFLGTGTVSFNYLTTSTFTILTGSDNAIIKLRAFTRLNVDLTYYWCPYAILGTNFTSFVLSQNGRDAVADWQVANFQPSTQYVLEVSTDGRNFQELSPGTPMENGTTAQFKENYTPAEGYSGYLFFRIKQTDPTGKYAYSSVKSLLFDQGARQIGMSFYPNPAVSGIQLQFLKNYGGNYLVEIINDAGQVIFTKNYSMTGPSSVNIQWPRKPAPGLYFLKVLDLNRSVQQVERLQIM